MISKPIQIAVDGFSSCGKSTLAKQLAEKLDYIYIDSGAMYRSVTLFAIENKLIKNGKVAVVELISKLTEITISFAKDKSSGHITYLNGKDVESEIRQIEVSSKVSYVSAIPEVRQRLESLQRELSAQKSVVMDGRDIGTVVFPNADIKLFVTASIEVRAKRRFDELRQSNPDIDFSTIMLNLSERDFIDQNRKDSPLKMAKDAILIDNSNLSREEQLNIALKIINNKLDADRN